VHVEHVIGVHGLAARQPVRLGQSRRVGDEAEGRAAARWADNLEEEQVVAPGKQPDPVGGDVRIADGTVGPVVERAKVILRTHPRGV